MVDPRSSESSIDNDSNNDEVDIADEDIPSCYVCWDDAASEENPLRRDCGCLGTSGWAHLQCLIATAEAKGRFNPLIDPLTRTWMHCNQCQQAYKDPTKTALLNAMAEFGPRWTERITSAGQSLLLYSLIFLYASSAGCAIDFVFKAGESTIWPCMESWWEDASERTHRTVFLSVGLGVLWFLYCHRWQLLRVLTQFVAIASTLLTVAVLIEGDLQEKCIALACSVPVAAVLMYRARREIRQEAMRMQRRGIVSSLLALGMLVSLAFLRYQIEKRVGDFYFRHLEPYSTVEKVSELVQRVQVMHETVFLEKSTRELAAPVGQHAVPPLQEYWSCCL